MITVRSSIIGGLLVSAFLFVEGRESSAQVTTRWSNTTKLDGSGNIANKMPRPQFKLDDVTVRKCLTVNKKTGAVTQRCVFKNTGNSQVKFLFCNMIELSSAAAQVPHTQGCSLGFDSTAMKWKCFPE